MIVKYVSARGSKFILNQDYEIAIKECNPYVTKWKVTAVEQKYGAKVSSIGKEPISLDITFKFRGSMKTIKDNLNAFFEECEKDILSETTGRLYFGDEYLNGWFLERDTEPSETFYGFELKVAFYAPYPFYIREVTKNFYPEGHILNRSNGSDGGIDYPYDYNYDYAIGRAGSTTWNIDHYTASEFLMTIYGPTENPKIVIAGHPYEVIDLLEAGDYLTIDSARNKVIKYRNNGTTANLFFKRATEASVFEKIPPGNIGVNWSGAFGFDITLYIERSEPRWN